MSNLKWLVFGALGAALLLFVCSKNEVTIAENIPVSAEEKYAKLASSNFVLCNELRWERLDTLTRTVFWRKLMNTAKDSLVFYSFHNKKVWCTLPAEKYHSWDDAKKDCFKDSLRLNNGLEPDHRITYATGRNHFYKVSEVVGDIEKSNVIFKNRGVDPFYAQAILLIESPGKLAKSNVGAYGPFQLMKSVGLKYGLKINAHVDERADLEKSAIAACKLISTICVPYTNKMLAQYNIAVCETDLWYRLLVLHVYHAGAGNVAKALRVIQPQTGNMELIKKLWQTNAGGFQNCSQNYSQVAIASLFELEAHLLEHAADL